MQPGSTCELSCKAGSTLTGGLLTCDDTDTTENPDHGWRMAKGTASCTPEPDKGMEMMMAASVGATAAVLVSGAVVIAIVVCISTTSAAGAATASMLLMKKYGLVFYKDHHLETDTQLMMSTEKIHVKQAADLSLQDSVEHIVALLAKDEGEDASVKLLPRKTCFQTQIARDSVKSLRLRLGSNFAKALEVHEVMLLRDRLRRSMEWSEDPGRPRICAEMSNDEAAAIMLYTQGWSD